MATSKEYLEFVLEQLAVVDGVSSRAMMGEYVLYFRGKVIGGIYDNRFLIKPVRSAVELMPAAPYEIPYEGAKPMLMVDKLENRELMSRLLLAMYDELPEPKSKKPKKNLSKEK